MRRLLVVAAVVVLITPSPARGQVLPPGCNIIDADVVCDGEMEVPGKPGSGGSDGDAPNGVWVSYPVVSTGPDGAPCIGTSGEWAADEVEADAIRLARGREFFFAYERDAADGPIANCPDAGPGAPG
ncbi:MAG: hypothetical protein KY469_05960, partial [Actinobacteria bacterium]|nr:hypothetical protein [Actinomycetota bacterium]